MATPEQQRNLELARGGLQGWIDGDREATLKTLAEDIEVYVPPELGNAGNYHGLDAFLRWNAEWEEAWSEFQMEILSAEPVGDRHVVFVVRSTGRGAGSGVEVANELGWVLGVRGDLCDYLALQPSGDEAVALAKLRELEG